MDKPQFTVAWVLGEDGGMEEHLHQCDDNAICVLLAKGIVPFGLPTVPFGNRNSLLQALQVSQVLL